MRDELRRVDPFINEGLSQGSESEGDISAAQDGPRVHAGKAKREEFKRRLFKAKARRKRHHEQRRREELGMSSDSGQE